MMAINSAQDFLDLVERALAIGPANSSNVLSNIYIGTNEIQHVANALASGRFPSNLPIKFKPNNLSDTERVMVRYGEMIERHLIKKDPAKLSITLRSNKIGNEGVRHLATALSSGKCPENLSIDLSLNDIGNEGAKHLATALSSGKCPVNLSIKLKHNHIHTEGVRHLTNALTTGRCPANLSIDLSYNIGTEGAKHLAIALFKTQIPDGFKIVLEEPHHSLIQNLLNNINKVEDVIGNSLATRENILQAINAAVALNALFPNEKRWSDNPLEALYAQYFQLQLVEILKADLSNPENRNNLEAIFHDFHARAKELNFPKTYAWQALLESFAKTFNGLPAQTAELETAKTLQFKELKSAFTEPSASHAATNNSPK